MSNKKIVLNPASWILDPDNRISFRYRLLTDDFNIRSAHSPIYLVDAPALIDAGGAGIFTEVDYIATTETVGGSTAIRLSWTTSPQYEGMRYFVFLNDEYLQTTPFASFTHVVSTSGTYTFKISLLNTTKTPLANTVLFTAAVTV